MFIRKCSCEKVQLRFLVNFCPETLARGQMIARMTKTYLATPAPLLYSLRVHGQVQREQDRADIQFGLKTLIYESVMVAPMTKHLESPTYECNAMCAESNLNSV